LSNLSYEEMMKISKDFYDTIDFTQFLNDKSIVDSDRNLDRLIEILENYYESEHPELLPKQFEGFFLNFVSDYEFGQYIAERYNYKLIKAVITTHYLIQGD